MKYGNKNILQNGIERTIDIFKKSKFSKIFIPLIGLLSLIWFLVRVIPKPVRASYPCMRIAFPLASGFFIWLTGLIASLMIIIKSNKYQFKYFIFSSIILYIIMNPNNNTAINASRDIIYSSKSSMIGSNNLQFDTTGNSGKLVNIGFVSSEYEPSDDELKKMIDEVIRQSLGEKGLSSIIKPGYKVVIKVNLVAPQRGAKGEKGRGIITDPRIVRYVAEKIREIIGFEKPADLKVIDGLFYSDKNPSLKSQETSFYYARLERTGDNDVNMEDICYDFNGDGILDGDSKAQLVNCDALGLNERYCTMVDEPILGKTKIYLPKFLRTKLQSKEDDDYCDVFIGLPVFKSHGFVGITGALKLHYGLRNYFNTSWDSGRPDHSGFGWGTGNKHLLVDYVIAEQKTRKYDFVIMDCLTGNRIGPLNTNFDDINAPTDYILSNTLLSATDPVAIDTVESIFAGYDPASIMLLNDAFTQGLGINKPELININGYDNFYKQKIFLYNKYHINNNKDYYRSYPFQDGWGGAKLLNDFTPPVILKINDPVVIKNNIYSIKFSAVDKGKNASGLARIELLINDNVISYKTDELNNSSIDADLKSFSGKTISYKIALWDKALNCSLSEEKQFKVP